MSRDSSRRFYRRKSAKHLQAYAHSQTNVHLRAWQPFNQKVGSSGDVGIWHETYVVPYGCAESVYVNMPRYGLGLAGYAAPQASLNRPDDSVGVSTGTPKWLRTSTKSMSQFTGA